MTLHVKNSAVWRLIQNAYIKISGTWRESTTVYVKDAGVWREVHNGYPGPGSQTFNTSGNFTVPLGVNEISGVLYGAGGGGGGSGSRNSFDNNSGRVAGGGGGGSGTQNFTVSVTGGATHFVQVSQGGAGSGLRVLLDLSFKRLSRSAWF